MHVTVVIVDNQTIHDNSSNELYPKNNVTFLQVHYNIGKVLVDRGRFAEGKEAYQEAIRYLSVRLHPEPS